METAKEFVVSRKIVKISYTSQFIKKNILWKKTLKNQILTGMQSSLV